MKFLYGFIFTVLIIAPVNLPSQDPLSAARITGNFQVDGQYYLKDTDIGTTRSEERRVGKECRYLWSTYH